jgi:hypothetical protein
MHFYGDIQRIDEDARMVWGYASTSKPASDGQTITRAALEAALEGYANNIREMHRSDSAVGVAMESHVDDEGLYIGAHVVDDRAWEKVVKRVYKGFSIGAKVTERDKIDRNLVHGINLIEISLVDRPGDPGATFDVWRADMPDKESDMTVAAPAPGSDESADDIERRAFTQAERDKMAKSGEAMKDGSFPIANRSDLENAIRAYGRAKNKRSTKAHIMKRAKALGAEDLIPDDWKGDDAMRADQTAEGEDTIERADPVAEAAAAAEAATQAAQATLSRLDADSAMPPRVIALPGADIRRGIPSVARLGYLLCELAYLAADTQWESDIEGDDSTVPGKLRAALLSLGAAYRAMNDEELAELLNGVGVDVQLENGVICLVAAGTDIRRAEGDHADVLARANSALGVLGFKPPAVAQADDLRRTVDTLTADRDTLLRSVSGLTEMMGNLVARVEAMGAQPLPPKTAAATIARVVSKEEDASGQEASSAAPSEADIRRVLDAMPDHERAHLLTKAALARPTPITR